MNVAGYTLQMATIIFEETLLRNGEKYFVGTTIQTEMATFFAL